APRSEPSQPPQDASSSSPATASIPTSSAAVYARTENRSSAREPSARTNLQDAFERPLSWSYDRRSRSSVPSSSSRHSVGTEPPGCVTGLIVSRKNRPPGTRARATATSTRSSSARPAKQPKDDQTLSTAS